MTAIYDSLMSHDINVIKRDKDFAGDFTDVETFPEKGFVQYTNTQMVTDDGEQFTAKAIVFLKDDTNFDETHPDWVLEHNGYRFKKRTTERIDDPRTGQTHHYEIGVI